MSFSDNPSQSAYLTIANNTDTGQINTNLNNIQNQTSGAYAQWDITQGFMGSNQLKQSQGGITSYVTIIFGNLKMLSTQVFGNNSPITIVIRIFSLMALGYLIYAFVQFIRQGR